jgi:sporulation protein YlmC with PRC-barrel domain
VILISELLEAEVLSEDGEKVGRVHDVRVERMQRRTPEGHRLKIVGLVIGRRGIRERFGLDTARTAKPIADRELIAWDRVVAIDAGVVRVRADS